MLNIWSILLVPVLLISACLTWSPVLFEAPSNETNSYTYETKYIDTLLDHFTFTNDNTFKLKYLLSTKYFKKGGPILFYTGNEGNIETFAEHTGFMWESAETLSAALVFAEHRYYGASMPFGEESFQNRSMFAYLTAEQALADYAMLVTSLLSEERFADSPVVAIGGSYGGMLAAWFRMKYPNLVNGAIAASAPVWMFPNMTDCGAFFATTTKAFEHDGSKVCKEKIQNSWKAIQTVADGPQGKELLKAVFMLCNPLREVQTLIDYLQDFLGTIAMVNYPYEASFLGKLPAYPVKAFCDKLLVSEDRGHPPVPLTAVQLFSLALRSLTNYTGTQKCVNLTAQQPGLDANAWELQTCMEMTVPMCTDGVHDMFPDEAWDATVFSDKCHARFGVTPRLQWGGVQFWGKQLQTATNIVFSNGDLDPWSALGVLTQDGAPACTVIRIPNGAHHLDLRAANPKDPSDVVEARQTELKMIQHWIAKK